MSVFKSLFAPGLALCLALGMSTLCAQEAGHGATTVKDVDLKASTSADSSTVAQLDEDSEVTLLERSGGWYRVRTEDGDEGWLKILSVRFAKIEGAASADLSAVVHLQSTSGSTLISGVRGMGSEQLQPIDKSAMPLDQVNQFKPADSDVAAFAEQGALHSQPLELAK